MDRLRWEPLCARLCAAGEEGGEDSEDGDSSLYNVSYCNCAFVGGWGGRRGKLLPVVVVVAPVVDC